MNYESYTPSRGWYIHEVQIHMIALYIAIPAQPLDRSLGVTYYCDFCLLSPLYRS